MRPRDRDGVAIKQGADEQGIRAGGAEKFIGGHGADVASVHRPRFAWLELRYVVAMRFDVTTWPRTRIWVTSDRENANINNAAHQIRFDEEGRTPK